MKNIRMLKTIELMKKAKIEGLLYATSANFQYLLDAKDYFWQRTCMNNIMGNSNFRTVPEALLYINTKGEYYICCIPALKDTFKDHENVFISYMDQMEDTIAQFIKEKNIGIGYACHDHLVETLKEVDPNIKTTYCEDLLNELRWIKDPAEIQIMKQNAKFTDDAVRYVCDHLYEGMSQYDAEKLLMDYGFMHGVQDFSFPPTCGFKTRGTEAAKDALTFSRDTKLTKGTAIAFDVGYMNHGYCSDWGRTVYYGTAPELVKNGYHALQAGQQAMVSKIIPNKTNINELYGMVLKKVSELGYGDYLRYQEQGMLGHQIGIDCHEHPMLNNTIDFVLKPGMIFCSEPKMFFENECYMRVEDMILITETKAEFLTNFDREYFEV